MKTLIHKIQIDNDSSLTFTLKESALNIFEEPQNNLWTYDLKGRLVGMFVNGLNFRRTLNNKFYLKTREEISNYIFRNVIDVKKETVIPLIEKAITIINDNIDKLPNEIKYYLFAIIGMNYNALEEDAARFSEIYLPISILPPDQYMSLVIQLTEGCNYNQCTFCNFYKDRPFKIKSIDELKLHIDNIKDYLDEGLKLRKSIFLADANAISAPQDRLIQALGQVQDQFPYLNHLYSFVDVFTGLKKSVNDFILLNQLGLKRVYLGVESGNSNLMLFLNKHQSNEDIIELTNTIKASGINVGIIFLIGAGGEQFAEKHLNDSIKLVQNLPLSKGDIIYLSELYETNSGYIELMEKNNYELPSKVKIRSWSNSFKKEIKKVISKEVQVSVYDINQFFY